jgi:hypothetical protein
MNKSCLLGAVCALSLTFPLSLQAATIWTDWTAATEGAFGTASGTLGGVTVSYAGEIIALTNIDGGHVSWDPATTYVDGGIVDTSPGVVGDILGLGSVAGTNTITFSSPVTDPVIALWSVGAASNTVELAFNITPTLVSSGLSNLSLAGTLVVSGNTAIGDEGNGTLLFTGTYSSITFISDAEAFTGTWGFTVGDGDAAGEPPPPPAAVPVPAAVWLFGSGLLGLVGMARRKKA